MKIFSISRVQKDFACLPGINEPEPGLTLSHKNGNTKISSPDVEEGALAEAPFSIAPLANECRTSPGNKEQLTPWGGQEWLCLSSHFSPFSHDNK